MRAKSQIGNQADVRAFRGLNRTHAAVVAVMNVADLKSGAVTGQAARAERGQTALMRKLGQGVGLIHELGQRRGAEELLDRRHNRTDINQRLRVTDLAVLACTSCARG